MKKKKTTIEDLAILVVNGFDEVKGELSGLKSEVGGLKSEVGGLKSEVGGLKEKVGKLETRMASVEYGQHEIKQKLDNAPYRFELEELKMKTERRFQKIEDKIGIKSKTK